VRGELKYMAFNIWGNYFGNPVFERDLKQAGYVLRNAPDLVGMQEAMPEFWSSRLFAKLGADYGIVRNEGNPKMEYNPLLWRKSRLELIEGGTHVYADNPEGSKGFGWGVFRDKATGRTLVRIDARYFRPTEVDTLLGDASKAQRELGWRAETGFEALVQEMVEADRTLAERDALIAREGFSVANPRE
jgi:hypothetical protein